MLSSGCVQKKPRTVNMGQSNHERKYQEAPDFVFLKLKEVLEKQFAYSFDFIDEEKMILSSQEIREKTLQGPVKYRVNASVTHDIETGASILRIYKQEKVFYNNRWQDRQSNGKLEEDIFEALKK